jgi:hypothetical protein
LNGRGNTIKNARYSAIYGDRIAIGCSLCMSGDKSVVFVTGLCREKCYYCPVSSERIRNDVFFVNERKVSNIDEAISEIARSGSNSASITGGDPLERLERTISVIEALKSSFGSSFHVHLYTNGILSRKDVLKALEKVGLDEIRFHPTREQTLKKIEEAKKFTTIKVGAEVPAIPGKADELVRLAEFLDKIGADFLNINELEASESNFNSLMMRGFVISHNGKSIEGSASTAIAAMKLALKKGLKIPIHFCPASFKDSIQTKNRFLKTIYSDRKVYEKATREGTVLYGVLLEYNPEEAEKCIKDGLLYKCGNSLCFHPDDIKYLKRYNLGCKGEIVEAHPTKDRFVINREEVQL